MDNGRVHRALRKEHLVARVASEEAVFSLREPHQLLDFVHCFRLLRVHKRHEVEGAPANGLPVLAKADALRHVEVPLDFEVVVAEDDGLAVGWLSDSQRLVFGDRVCQGLGGTQCLAGEPEAASCLGSVFGGRERLAGFYAVDSIGKSNDLFGRCRVAPEGSLDGTHGSMLCR